MAKIKKRDKQAQSKKKTSKRERKRDITSSQTNQPFEQDTKRRIGPYGRSGEPPIMQ